MKKTREIHAIPSTDRKFKHKLNTNCACEPQITKSKDGKLIVEHTKMGKGRDLWYLDFGIDGQKVDVADFFEGDSQKNIDKFLKAVQSVLPARGSD